MNQVSNYWLTQINERFKGMGFQTFSGAEFQEAYIINLQDNKKYKYKILFNKIVNSLQLYRFMAYLPQLKKDCNKSELICSYGNTEKSIDVLIDDIFKELKDEEKFKSIDWSKYCLKSTYHESNKQEFYLKVFKVLSAVPTGFNGIEELCFDCEAFKDQNVKVERSKLRCSLIGSLYEIVKIPNQFITNHEGKRIFTIFDFL